MGPTEQFLLIIFIFAGIFIISSVIAILRAYFLYNPKGKGMLGEWIMRHYLGKSKPGVKYVINDIIISDEQGNTSQIDHILICHTGIYVIETKNYSGRIYGSADDKEWTQVLHYGKVKNKFYNPIKQNATHVYRLKQLLHTSLPVRSLVVFIANDLKYVKADNVMSASKIMKTVRKGAWVIDPIQMAQVYDQIVNIKSSNTVTKAEHIKNINASLKDIQDNICPRCKGKLVEREGKYGKFYGCSNYPKCRFIKNNSENR